MVIREHCNLKSDLEIAFTPNEEELGQEKIFAMLGIIHLTTDSFLFLVTRVETVGTIQGSHILKITRV